MRLRLVGCWATVALLGCAQTEPSCAEVSLDDLSARLAARVCRCWGGVSVLALGYFPDDCEAAMTEFYAEGQVAHLRALLAAGAATYAPDATARWLCAPDICLTTGLAQGSGERVAIGTTPDGGACAYDDDCAATSVCGSGTGCTSTCQHCPQVGEPCRVSSDCDNPVGGNTPLWCSAGVCVPVPGEGEPCGDGRCDFESSCTLPEDICTAPVLLAEGTTCRIACPAGETSCPTPTCASGLVCVASTGSTMGVCSPALSDGSCRQVVFGLGGSDCPPTWSCTGASIGVRGSCVPPPGLRQPCSGGLAPCASGLRCLRNECYPVGHLGDTCIEDFGCISELCQSGHCATPPVCSS